MITDTNGSIVTEHGPYHRYQLGPELNMAAGNVHHDVSLGLLRDQEYCLIVTLATVSYVTTSGSYYFGIKCLICSSRGNKKNCMFSCTKISTNIDLFCPIYNLGTLNHKLGIKLGFHYVTWIQYIKIN